MSENKQSNSKTAKKKQNKTSMNKNNNSVKNEKKSVAVTAETKKTKGVKDATVNFMALKMKVEFEDGADVDAVMQDVIKNCKVVEDDCEIFL